MPTLVHESYKDGTRNTVLLPGEDITVHSMADDGEYFLMHIVCRNSDVFCDFEGEMSEVDSPDEPKPFTGYLWDGSRMELNFETLPDQPSGQSSELPLKKLLVRHFVSLTLN